MGKPTVGVVVPNYNGGRFIRDCLDSLLSQRPALDEILVMDGGSTDETVEILKSYGDKIRWVSEADEGQADAIERGMAQMSTELIGWLNSDDVMCPGTVAATIKAAQSNPKAVLFYGDVLRTDVHLKPLRVSKGAPHLDWEMMRSGRGITLQPGSIYRMSAIRQIGGVNKDFFLLMDVDLWIRLLAVGEAVYLNQVVAWFRVHEDAKSSLYDDQYEQETLKLGVLHESDRLFRSTLRRVARLALHRVKNRLRS